MPQQSNMFELLRDKSIMAILDGDVALQFENIMHNHAYFEVTN